MDIDKAIEEMRASIREDLAAFWIEYQAERYARAFDRLGSARFTLGSWYGLLHVKGGIALAVGNPDFCDERLGFVHYNDMIRDRLCEIGDPEPLGDID